MVSALPADRDPPRFVLRAGAATLLAGGVAVALDVSPLASALLGSAIYIAALLAFGIISAEIRQALFRRRRPAA
jgi:hypothetical protein